MSVPPGFSSRTTLRRRALRSRVRRWKNAGVHEQRCSLSQSPTPFFNDDSREEAFEPRMLQVLDSRFCSEHSICPPFPPVGVKPPPGLDLPIAVSENVAPENTRMFQDNATQTLEMIFSQAQVEDALKESAQLMMKKVDASIGCLADEHSKQINELNDTIAKL